MARRNEETAHVWVRTDVAEAVLQYDGKSLPPEWKLPSSHTRAQSLTSNDPFAWGWARARVVASHDCSSPSAASRSGSSPRRGGGGGDAGRIDSPSKHTPSRSSNSSSSSSSNNHVSPFGKVNLRRVRGSPFRSPSSTSSGRSHRRKTSWSSATVTLILDDTEFAPDHLQNVTVTIPPTDTSNENKRLVCTANLWSHGQPNNQTVSSGSSVAAPEDLTSLTHLHEPAVVFCLKRRYEADFIYTYTGKILLALNPFRVCEHLYGEPMMQRYWKESDGVERPPPHVYAIAQDAYGSMLRAMQMTKASETALNQSILVSGESGAGKTVTTKIIMRYLATLSKNKLGNTEDNAAVGNTDCSIESQVLQSNPILESFGNARTVRNDNSSRFGKFIEIQFLSSGSLVCASIETYLLEKVRLITQAQGERNYHVFYELMAGATIKDKKTLHILRKTPRDFRMTCESGTFDRRDGVEDRDTYRDLRNALDTVGFSLSEQTELFTVACALLHASNLTFVETGEDASELDTTNSSLRSAVALLGVPTEVLNDALCTTAISAGGELLLKNMSVPQAKKALEALIKAVYGALFAHIASRVNSSIFVKKGTNLLSTGNNKSASIGVLDIFGFESFATNSFEQLCINYCNEALQQQFNRFVFKLEQQEYEREGIEWSFITFPDNQDVLDLIDKKHTGILSVLDEQCRVPSSDKSFARATYEKCSDNPRFTASNTQKVSCTFTINHYAGLVEYDTVDFLEKNKDELSKESTDLLLSSSNRVLPILGTILSGPAQNSTSNRKQLHRQSSSILRESVGGQFCSQLRALRNRIEATTPHYVRCLKPNDELVPDNFNPLIIADQLRCAGVLEAIRVSRVGFPQRYAHEAFVQRYRVLALQELNRVCRRLCGVDLCEHLVKIVALEVADALAKVSNREDDATLLKTSPKSRRTSPKSRTTHGADSVGIQMGRTKVFLRRRAFDCLEHLRTRKVNFAATKIQSCMRMYLAKSLLYFSQRAVLIIQSFARRASARQLVWLIKSHIAAEKIQCLWRRYAAWNYLSATLYLTKWCQSTYRGAISREYSFMLLQVHKASVIQRCCRRYIATKNYYIVRHLVLEMQRLVRSRQARTELTRRKREARNLNTVAVERDNFKHEAARLRSELEQAKRKSKLVCESSPPELLHLRNEVKKLRNRPPPASVCGSPSEISENYDQLLTQKDREIEKLKQQITSLHETTPTKPLMKRRERSPRLSWPSPDDSQNDLEIERLKHEVESLQGSASNERALTMQERLSRRFMSPGPRDDTTAATSNIIKKASRMSRMSPMRLWKTELSTESSCPNRESAEMPERHVVNTSFQSPSSISLLDTEGDDNFLEKVATDMDSSVSPVRLSTPDASTPGFQSGQFFPQKELILHRAVSCGDKEMLGELLQTLSNIHLKVNEGDAIGRTPLHLAALSSNLEIASLLLENDGIANSQDHEGNTPLHLASTGSMTALLIEEGRARPIIPNLDGVCALHIAVGRKDLAAVKHILRHFPDVNAADDINWFTPLHVVAVGGEEDPECDSKSARKQIASLLCGVTEPSEPDLNYQDIEGNTPLHHAAVLTNEDAFDLFSVFLGKGADPNLSNHLGQAPFHLLCHNEYLRKIQIIPEMIDLMLFHNADPNLQSNTGCTPLHLSLYHKDIESAVQLVNGGAELHIPWRKPNRWSSFWDDMGAPDVLVLDMVQDEHSLHRILASITKPQKQPPTRLSCMQCKKILRRKTTMPEVVNCQHCSRLVCESCTQPPLPAEFFPKSFEVQGSGCVCTVCETILLSRKDDDGSATQPTTSIEDDDQIYSRRLLGGNLMNETENSLYSV